MHTWCRLGVHSTCAVCVYCFTIVDTVMHMAGIALQLSCTVYLQRPGGGLGMILATGPC